MTIIRITVTARQDPSGGSRASPRYPARMPDNYSGQDLRGRDFSGQDLADANLFHADLTDAVLHGATLSGAYLINATLTGADFTDADLTDAFRRPGISRADMEGAIGLDKVMGLID